MLLKRNSPLCHLKNEAVDVWVIDVARLHVHPGLAQIDLLEGEKARIERFYFAKHRQRQMVIKKSVRIILANYLNCKASEVTFATKRHGKPYLVNKKLRFNLTHSGDLALLALSKDNELGIDIEKDSERPFDALAKRFFSQNESEAVTKLKSIYAKQQLFFRIWSAKEAFIKAVGLGLSYPLDDFTIPYNMPLESMGKVVDNHNKTWFLTSFKTQTYASALCMATAVKIINNYDFYQTLPMLSLV
jgi:4'-phosphopantetheinyl transferase